MVVLNAKNPITKVELTIRKYGRDGWKEKNVSSGFGEAVEGSYEFAESIITKYGDKHEGSFQVILRVNNGPAKGGATTISNVKDEFLCWIWDPINAMLEAPI